MKKVLCIALAAVMLCLLCACNFTTNFSDSMGMTSAQCIPQVEAVLQALTDGDTDAALEQMHPDIAENAGDAVAQIADFLQGRSVTQLKQQSVSVNTSTGTAGKVRQEKVAFQAMLDDGTVFYISAAHRTDNGGEGFVSFQIVLGVV